MIELSPIFTLIVGHIPENEDSVVGSFITVVSAGMRQNV
jgi:hypothetical protein